MTKFTDLIHNTKAVVAVDLKTQVSGGNITGEIIDTQGFYAMLLALTLGSASTTTVKIKSIKESNDNRMAGATDVPASNLIGLGVGEAIETLKTTKCVNIVPTKRYVQVEITTTGDNALVGATGLLFGADVNGNINL